MRSGERHQVEVAVVPEVLVGVGKEQDALRVEGGDGTGIMGDEDDGSFVVTQGCEDFFT